MSRNRLIVVGAGGRMGRMLVRTIAETSGAVLSGAIEAQGSPFIGQDSGLLAGIGANGVLISDDPLPLFAASDEC